MTLAWNATELKVTSDDARRAKYRALQSWYRENILQLPPGLEGETPRANLLPAAAVEADASLNFLRDGQIAAYVKDRANLVVELGGTLEKQRLMHNLLSSMPLCFNIFGKLRSERAAAARVLARLYDLPIAAIDEIEVEWAPADHPLQDRTAFDAWVAYRTDEGRRGFLGVETKYTEPFSERPLHRLDRYRGWNDFSGSGFQPGATDALAVPATAQLWRNALLAVAVRADGDWELGHVAVLALEGDPGVTAALGGLRGQHRDLGSLVRSATLEQLVRIARDEPTLESWANAFEQRYLDLTPIA